jgi:FkbM family methyltransferase
MNINIEAYVSRRRNLQNWLTTSSYVRCLMLPTSRWIDQLCMSYFHGHTLVLRSTDIPTFIEIFSEGEYEHLMKFVNPDEGGFILDFGANIGLFALWCAVRLPQHHVVCHEPILEHLHAGQQNTSVTHNVVWRKDAVSNKCYEAVMSVDGPASKLDDVSGERCVSVVDMFELYGDVEIDVCKMDIEGSEYDIISDERFVSFSNRVKVLALEWHGNSKIGSVEPESYYRNRLTELGRHVIVGKNYHGLVGVLFSVRSLDFASSF